MLSTVKGERGSGTNYLAKLLKVNTALDYVKPYWKHGRLSTDELDYYSRDDVYCFIISKNIFEWLPSLSRYRWHIDSKSAFYKFIREPVVTRANNEVLAKYYDVGIGTVIDTYANPIEMYQAKYGEFALIPGIYVKYDDLLFQTDAMFKLFAAKYAIPIKLNRTSIVKTQFKFDGPRYNYYLYKHYMREYSIGDIEFIFYNLDYQLSKVMKYDEYYRKVASDNNISWP